MSYLVIMKLAAFYLHNIYFLDLTNTKFNPNGGREPFKELKTLIKKYPFFALQK